MSPKFKDYLAKQLKNYLVIVVLSTTAIFIALTFSAFSLYANLKLKQDNNKITEIIQKDYDNIYNSFLYIDKEIESISEGKKDELYDHLYTLRSNSEIKFNFTILDFNNNVIVTNLYKDNEEIMLASYEYRSAINQFNVLNSNRVTEEAIKDYNDFQKSVMTIVFRGENGYFIVEPLYESFIKVEHQLSSNLVVTDRYNNVLYDNTSRYQNEIGKLKYDNKDNEIYTQTLEVFNVTSIKAKTITPAVVVYTITAVIIALIMLLKMLNPVIKKIVKGLDVPLDELLRAIEANKNGNLDYYIDSHHFLEFDTIYQEFNDLMQSTKELMTKNEDLSETKKIMEIKHLKNQFNPHFMYNTLESIRYEVMFDQITASDMLLSLGRLMQYSIENLDKLVKVKEDFKYLEDYLKLQKMRFKERLDYTIDLNETISDFKIPKLLIQPIIENSIKHNMESVDILKIVISGYRISDEIYFEVRDYGLGINQSKISEINETLNKKNIATNNLGLHNINRTIKLMYGEDYGLYLSNEDKGLKVTVKLPLEKGILWLKW